MTHSKNICFVAGRSGGHITPALTLAQHHKQAHPHGHVLFFTTDAMLDRSLLRNHPSVDTHIPLALGNFPRSRLTGYPKFMWQCMRSFFTSLKTLRAHRPTKVVSTGGYISIPVCIAAWILRIPVELYELNAIPGQAASLVSRFASSVVICFPKTASYFPTKTCSITPYPIRFTAQQTHVAKEQTRTALGFSQDRTTVFLLGGSQGSIFINELMQQLITANPQLCATVQVIHQTGAHDNTDWKQWYARHGIPAHVFTYHAHVEQYYALADLIICRSGAGTLWEIAFFGKKAITIPIITKTTDHQVDNARAIASMYPELFTVILQHEIQKTGIPIIARQLLKTYPPKALQGLPEGI